MRNAAAVQVEIGGEQVTIRAIIGRNSALSRRLARLAAQVCWRRRALARARCRQRSALAVPVSHRSRHGDGTGGALVCAALMLAGENSRTVSHAVVEQSERHPERHLPAGVRRVAPALQPRRPRRIRTLHTVALTRGRRVPSVVIILRPRPPPAPR